MSGGPSRGRNLLAALALAALTLAVFRPVMGYQFLNYDDGVYVVGNPRVAGGLTPENLRWALTTTHAANWHPLTWLSHQADASLFGLEPRGHHLTSLLLHSLNAALLFLALAALTGAFWPALLAAALFTLHPLHVESVAWISERKDVLLGLCWMLTLLGYLRYVRRPGIVRFMAVVGLFALALAAKPMGVTLPFVLLLLDWWPLGRLGTEADRTGRLRRWGVLVREKVPLLALSLASALLTYRIQRGGGAMRFSETITMPVRFANALLSYMRYLAKTIWPVHLAVFYPHPLAMPPIGAILGAAVILMASIVLVLGRRRSPYLAVGWFWYLGTLVPVIGLVQVGGQSMADRYTYLPLIGLFLMAAWGVQELARRRGWRWGVVTVAAAILLVLIPLTRVQLGYWQDSRVLFTRALAVTRDNWFAHNGLGMALWERKEMAEAERQFRETVRIAPLYAKAWLNLGTLALAQGQKEEAKSDLAEAIRLRPDFAEARENLGNVLLLQGETGEALAQLVEAARLAPGDARAEQRIGNLLVRQGRLAEAEVHYRAALEAEPRSVDTRYNLGVVLADLGRPEEAEVQYRQALRERPGDAAIHDSLGAALASRGLLPEAMEHFREAVRLEPNRAGARFNLGLALLRTEHLGEAREQFTAALKIDPHLAEARAALHHIDQGPAP